jgi:PAS domain-containing protein
MDFPIDMDHFCLMLVREAPDAIIFADAEGVIRFWNRSAERIFGFAEAEALGQSLDILIPEILRARHWAGFFGNDAERKHALWLRRDSGGTGAAKRRPTHLDRVHDCALPRQPRADHRNRSDVA